LALPIPPSLEKRRSRPDSSLNDPCGITISRPRSPKRRDPSRTSGSLDA
ncbi:hypothetical protein T03_4946, partial [Trichinella britovi]